MNQQVFPPVATFSIVRLAAQGYAEIDPSFITEHFNNLKKKWFIIEINDSFCTIQFNQSYENPLISIGWKQLAEALQLPDNVEIDFAYYGNNLFRVQNFRQAPMQDELKPFHSRSLFPLLTQKFDIHLDSTTIVTNKLILPPDFANYLKNNDYEELLLCADYNRKELMKVFKSENPDKTELGDNWMRFCRQNDFYPGEKIRFKFHVNDPHKRCHVFVSGRF